MSSLETEAIFHVDFFRYAHLPHKSTFIGWQKGMGELVEILRRPISYTRPSADGWKGTLENYKNESEIKDEMSVRTFGSKLLPNFIESRW